MPLMQGTAFIDWCVTKLPWVYDAWMKEQFFGVMQGIRKEGQWTITDGGTMTADVPPVKVTFTVVLGVWLVTVHDLETANHLRLGSIQI